MFTGLIEEVGRVERVEELDRGRRLTVRSPGVSPGLEAGASIAVDGACLTVVAAGGERFRVEVIGTTLSRTIVRTYEEGRAVNLERALSLGERLEGHLVQGHVDGVGVLLDVRREGEHRLLDLRIPPEVWDRTILHGSIAVNGISLTVNDLTEPDRCQVAIIPHTWKHTNLSELVPGDEVNVEGDLIGKYVGKMLRPRGRNAAPNPPDSRSPAGGSGRTEDDERGEPTA